MSIQSDKSDQEFKMNRNVTVRIKTKRTGDWYTHDVIVSSVHTSDKPLTFNDKDEIIDFISNIDLDEEQQELPLNGQTKIED